MLVGSTCPSLPTSLYSALCCALRTPVEPLLRVTGQKWDISCDACQFNLCLTANLPSTQHCAARCERRLSLLRVAGQKWDIYCNACRFNLSLTANLPLLSTVLRVENAG